MEGFKIWVGHSKNACMYSYLLNKEDAEKLKQFYINEHLPIMKDGCTTGIEEVDLNKCECGRYYEVDDECMFCEEARYEAMVDYRENHKDWEGEDND
jgi:hypothetical protein